MIPDSDAVRLYKAKTVIMSLSLIILGVLGVVVGKVVAARDDATWVQAIPLGELGSTLFVTGALVITWEYLDARDRERREDARIRRLLQESAPAFRDAVVQGFAVSPDDLDRVATPALLDSLATNAPALRLGDAQFASEIYADIRDQAVRAPERWHDVQVQVKLSNALERSATGAPLFDVLVEWEYTTVPTHPVQRFACVSDRDEFHDLISDVPATLTWLMTKRHGLDAREQKITSYWLTLWTALSARF